MTDSRLQQLKRTWEASESVEDEAAYLRERMRVGDLPQDRVWLAAVLNHPAARLVIADPDLAEPYPVRHWDRDSILGAKVVEAVTRDGRAGETGLRILLAVADFMLVGTQEDPAGDPEHQEWLSSMRSAVKACESALRGARGGVDYELGGEPEDLELHDWILDYYTQFSAGAPPSGHTFELAARQANSVGHQEHIEAQVVPWLLGQDDPLA